MKFCILSALRRILYFSEAYAFLFRHPATASGDLKASSARYFRTIEGKLGKVPERPVTLNCHSCYPRLFLRFLVELHSDDRIE